MARRTLLLIASILIAAAGTALVWVYVQSADARARHWAEPVSVLVAGQTIEPGTPASSLTGRVSTLTIPRTLAPLDRVASLPPLGAKVVTTRILAGQYLVAGQFGEVAQDVAATHMGVSVTMEDPNRVAGLLRAGSRVAVYYVVSSGEQAKPTGEAHVLLPWVNVLAVGSTTIGATTTKNGQTQVPSAVVTLDVTGPQATRVILASQTGTLYFALLGKDAQASPTDDVTVSQLLSRANG